MEHSTTHIQALDKDRKKQHEPDNQNSWVKTQAQALDMEHSNKDRKKRHEQAKQNSWVTTQAQALDMEH